MESTNASKGGNASYTVSLASGSTFFSEGDNNDDWTNCKTDGPDGDVGDVGTLDENSGKILEDWVGCGDAVDYKKFTLDSAAKLRFTVASSDAVKFTVYKLNSKEGKNGTTYSLKAVSSAITVAKNGENTTKEMFFDKAGDYYFLVESTNASKGGNASYSVSLASGSTFYTEGDNNDDWTNCKTDGPDGDVGDVGALDKSRDILVEDWVGCGDTIDYRRFTVAGSGKVKVSFTLSTTDAAKFVVYKLNSTTKKGITTYSLKALQTTAYKTGVKDKTTKVLTLVAGEDYCFSMASTNASSGGSAYYTVAVNQAGSTLPKAAENSDAHDASALDMPETSVSLDSPDLLATSDSGLTMQDDLNFGQYGAGTLLAASPNLTSEKIFEESGKGILA